MHPATDVVGFLRSMHEHTLPIAAAHRAACGEVLGAGIWWNQQLVHELTHNAGALAEVRDLFLGHDLPLSTLNVFPLGVFHGAEVKTSVYAPDWLQEERLLYVRQTADLIGRLAPMVTMPRTITMSTLPLGYRPNRQIGDEEWRRMGRNLVRATSHLAAVEAEHGVHLQLCLEPEPFCLLETVAETADFLEAWVFAEGAWTVPEATLRRHLGVCVDLCHLAVVNEDPVAAVRDLQARQIAVGKVQVSCCLELRDPADAAAMDRLLSFDEPVYLHQTVADDGRRALDLAEVRRRRVEFAASGRLRTHFHTPVFWDEDGGFGSTRAQMLGFLGQLPSLFPGERPLLEVETYTWGVLPEADLAKDLNEGILRELAFVRRAVDENPCQNPC